MTSADFAPAAAGRPAAASPTRSSAA